MKNRSKNNNHQKTLKSWEKEQKQRQIQKNNQSEGDGSLTSFFSFLTNGKAKLVQDILIEIYNHKYIYI